MTDNLTQPAPTQLAIPPGRLELAIAAWLNAKAGRSQSSGTREKYERTLHSYQAVLQLVGLDLDSSAAKAMGLVAQEWAARRSDDSHWSGDVAASTFNNRLAIISSFFTFAARRELIPDGNPTIYVERRRTQQYAHAQAIDSDTIREALQKIDRSTLQGKRDYALLVLGLSTGRRLSELGGLRCGDVVVAGETVTVTFRRTKGGKAMRDELPHPVGKALLDWLHSYHGTRWPDEAPVWVRLTRAYYGAALGWQSIGDICQRWLGTAKVHTLRHTFAHVMEQQGARVTEIQQRLGHSDLSTTGRYLEALASARNSHGEAVAAALGVE
jgi:integrase